MKFNELRALFFLAVMVKCITSSSDAISSTFEIIITRKDGCSSLASPSPAQTATFFLTNGRLLITKTGEYYDNFYCCHLCRKTLPESINFSVDGNTMEVPTTILMRLWGVIHYGWQLCKSTTLPKTYEMITYLALGKPLSSLEDVYNFAIAHDAKIQEEMTNRGRWTNSPGRLNEYLHLLRSLPLFSDFDELKGGDILAYWYDQKKTTICLALKLCTDIYITFVLCNELNVGTLKFYTETEFRKEHLQEKPMAFSISYRKSPPEELLNDQGKIPFPHLKTLIEIFRRDKPRILDDLAHEKPVYVLDHLLPCLARERKPG